MTHEYKIGDKVLVEAVITKTSDPNNIGPTFTIPKSAMGFGECSTYEEFIRPHTPRQEFEYGEEVEIMTDQKHIHYFEDRIFISAETTYTFPNYHTVLKYKICHCGKIIYSE